MWRKRPVISDETLRVTLEAVERYFQCAEGYARGTTTTPSYAATSDVVVVYEEAKRMVRSALGVK